MMKHEFEKLVGREVTAKQYDAIETLYMCCELKKQDFAKSIKAMLKTIPRQEKEKTIILIGIPDNSGYYKTPNGCWHHTILAELIDISIETGKYIVKKIENSYDTRGVSWGDIYVRDLEVEFVA